MNFPYFSILILWSRHISLPIRAFWMFFTRTDNTEHARFSNRKKNNETKLKLITVSSLKVVLSHFTGNIWLSTESGRDAHHHQRCILHSFLFFLLLLYSRVFLPSFYDAELSAKTTDFGAIVVWLQFNSSLIFFQRLNYFKLLFAHNNRSYFNPAFWAERNFYVLCFRFEAKITHSWWH